MTSKVILFFYIVGALSTLGAAKVSEVSFTRERGESVAFGQHDRVQLQTAEALVDLQLSDGTPSKGDLLVLFDPGTERFLWREGTHSPDAPFDLELRGGIVGSPWHALVSSPSRLLWVQAGGMSLDVQYSTETAKNLDDAFNQALSELNSGWTRYYQKAEYPNRKTVDFVDQGLLSFLDNPNAPTLVIPRIENIQLTDSGYVVTLFGMWRGEVTIGEDLTVKERFHKVDGESGPAKR